MESRPRHVKPTRVSRYDGQNIWTCDGPTPDYELGSFLGGGAAGVVYEAECVQTKRSYAIKVLNPTGYKLSAPAALRQCEVAAKGAPFSESEGPLTEAHVWWLLQPNTRQLLAAYFDARTGQLRELTLPRCAALWGLDALPPPQQQQQQHPSDANGGGGGSAARRAARAREKEAQRAAKERGGEGVGPGAVADKWGAGAAKQQQQQHALAQAAQQQQQAKQQQVVVNGEAVTIPALPPKYAAFLAARAHIFREISSMRTLSSHPNILGLKDALELVQDTKATVFLVLELARGGELFDRIKIDCGAEEHTARGYFRQLLGGVRHCHDRGVCHRDLKPENLLLADNSEHPVLKIADFGFSALLLPERAFRFEDTALLQLLPAALHLGFVDESAMSPKGVGAARRRGRDVKAFVFFNPDLAVSGSGGIAADPGYDKPYYVAPEVLGSGGVAADPGYDKPYYVAPEVLGSGGVAADPGYDGTKADCWSMGVILYAMLAGSLPFEKDLHTCLRFEKFSAWARTPAHSRTLREHCIILFASARGRAPRPLARAARALHHPYDFSAWARTPARSRALRDHCIIPFAAWARTPARSRALREHCIIPPAPLHDAALGLDYPPWFFLRHLSAGAKSLLSGLLHPDPRSRLSVRQALNHPWVRGGGDGGAAAAGGGSRRHRRRRCPRQGPELQGVEEESATSVAAEQQEQDGVVAAAAALTLQPAAASDARAPPAAAPLPAEHQHSCPARTSQQPVRAIAAEPIIVESPPLLMSAAGRQQQQQQHARRAAQPPPRTSSSAHQQPQAAHACAPPPPPVEVIVPTLIAAAAPQQQQQPAAAPPLTPTATPPPQQQQQRRWQSLDPELFSSPPLAPRGGRGGEPPSPAAFALGASAADGGFHSRRGAQGAGGEDAKQEGGGGQGGEAARKGNAGGTGEGGGEEVPPVCRGPQVARSSRFTTNVPATEVLRKVSAIINEDPHPLPYPYQKITQKAVVHWRDFRLEVMRGGVLVCTVQIYLMRPAAAQGRQYDKEVLSCGGGGQGGSCTGLYMVEFLRGQIDIFLFKRLYEGVRKQLSTLVKHDYRLMDFTHMR
ncbi:hypothetical protein JKP88DRAFT_350214 [Tribonema minus]|uniref:non-specific serine/threonine protein kinase n=1 Tax=Tribonema minus TaxID=303371 RepID=A0A836CC79_9STRA|nr:hypothetical protein JKP88DRAFT_350214 [Tribonema minus]